MRQTCSVVVALIALAVWRVDWANAQALIGLNLMGLGSVLAIAGGLAFVINMGLPLLRRRETAP